MITLHLRAYPVLIAFLIWTSVSAADFPVFGKSDTVVHPEFGKQRIVVLLDDKDFGPFSAQAVVIDDEGYVLAATPVSMRIQLHCSEIETGRSCVIYDPVNGVVYEPDFENGEPGRFIEENGGPTSEARPDRMGLSYGFLQRPVTMAESIRFEFGSIRKAPGTTLLAVLWWCAAWALLARMLWRWQGNRWWLSPITRRAVLLTVLSIVILLGMSVLAAIGYAFAPYSRAYFFFVFASGAALAFAVMRPRRT